MRYLLDVNVLLAAIWATHVDHAKVDRWIEGKEFATCPITDLGFLRISTNPKALNAAMASARTLLQGFLAKYSVEFVAADLPGIRSNAKSSNLVMDLYLAELAESKGLKLATLDQGIRHAAVEMVK